MSDHRFQNCVTKEAKILLKLIIVCEIVQYHQSYTNFTSHSPSLYKVHAHGYFFSVSKNAEFIEFPGGLVQDLALSLLWLGLLLWLWFNSWPKNFGLPWAWSSTHTHTNTHTHTHTHTHTLSLFPHQQLYMLFLTPGAFHSSALQAWFLLIIQISKQSSYLSKPNW